MSQYTKNNTDVTVEPVEPQMVSVNIVMYRESLSSVRHALIGIITSIDMLLTLSKPKTDEEW